MELLLSPIGLAAKVLGHPSIAGMAGEEVVFVFEKLSPRGNPGAFDVCHLMFRQRPPPRPP